MAQIYESAERNLKPREEMKEKKKVKEVDSKGTKLEEQEKIVQNVKSQANCPRCGRNHGGECPNGTLTCFRCRKSGHFASRCPNKGGLRRQNLRDEQGKKIVLDEPRPQAIGLDALIRKDVQDPLGRNHDGKCPQGTLTCYRCGKPGHFARRCPNKGGQQRQNPQDEQGKKIVPDETRPQATGHQATGRDVVVRKDVQDPPEEVCLSISAVEALKMRLSGHYADSEVNAYVSGQMHHMSAQRMQQNSAMSHFPGRLDALSSEEEGQCQWDRDGPKTSNSMSSHAYSEGQGGDPSRSYYQGERPYPKLGLEKQANKDPRSQSHEEDMEIGYEDATLPQIFEGLEQKFLDEIVKLTKEQNDAEDAENAKHREKINAINNEYQEKLNALRACHSTRRDEFFRRESQVRQHQYQAEMSPYTNSMGQSEPKSYGAAAATAAAGEAHRAYASGQVAGEAHRGYASGQFDSYREQAQFLAAGRSHGLESRGLYPGGRVYNTGARYY